MLDRNHLQLQAERTRGGLVLRHVVGVDDVGRVADHGDPCRAGHRVARQLQELAPFGQRRQQAGDVAARPRQARDEAGADRVGDPQREDRDRQRRLLGGECGGHAGGRDDQVDVGRDQLARERVEALVVLVGPAVLDRERAAFAPAEVAQRADQGRQRIVRLRRRADVAEDADPLQAVQRLAPAEPGASTSSDAAATSRRRAGAGASPSTPAEGSGVAGADMVASMVAVAPTRRARMAVPESGDPRAEPSRMLTLLFDGIAYGMLLFVLAVGLAVTLGLMNFINLAHGAFAMAGGYITVLLMNRARRAVPASACRSPSSAPRCSARCSSARSTGRCTRSRTSTRCCSRSASSSWRSTAVDYVVGSMQQNIHLPAWLQGRFAIECGRHRQVPALHHRRLRRC